MNVYGLPINFPDLEGSERQIWYAEQLREMYVLGNIERFKEIAESIELEADNNFKNANFRETGNYRDRTDNHTFTALLSEEELVCLNCESAGAIIGFFKDRRPELIEKEYNTRRGYGRKRRTK